MRERLNEILRQSEIPLCGIAPMPEEGMLIPCRAKSRLPKNSKSVIVCLFPYYSDKLLHGNISKYAMVEDYHHVVGDILNEVCKKLQSELDYEFVSFADNSPIQEIPAAIRAGLGIMGKNSLLITPDYGTYQFIGEIVTDMELKPDTPKNSSCINCGKCQRACPGKAISEGKIDINKCASHINQLKRELTSEETLLIKRCGLIWGCDICQSVCEHNKNILETPIRRFRENIICKLDMDDIMANIKTRAFGFRGSKPLLRNYGIINPGKQN